MTTVEMSSEEGDWQNVSPTIIKRRRRTPLKQQLSKRLNMSEPPLNNSNKFSVLSEDEGEEETSTNNTTIVKPPPIYIPNVVNVSQMMKSFATVLNNSEFNYKTITGGQIRINVRTIEAYRAFIKFLETKKIAFHTFQIKQERAFRVVVKNLHYTTPIDDIKIELQKQGHKVRNIVNARSRATKEPLSMFFVDLEPNSDTNKKMYNIKHINNAIIVVEPPILKKEVVQCHRCQQFGHTKAYCTKPFKCVKCGLDHPTAACTKAAESPARCINCLGNHTASYKGCRIYQELLQKKSGTLQKTAEPMKSIITGSDFPQLGNSNTPTSFRQQNTTYADIFKGNSQSVTTESSTLKKIEELIMKQTELTNTLLHMMSILIEKLCK